MELLEQYFDTAFVSPNGIKELRNLILKLAMMGTLVPQDKNDQPASELLKEIKAEKEKLVAEGKIKKQKPLTEIKAAEVPYELPEGWVWCRLGNVIELISGQHLRPHEYNESENGIPYYTGPADFGTLYPISKRWTLIEKSIALSNDILLTVKGAGVGKTNIVNTGKAAISRQLMAIRNICIENEFLNIYLTTMFQKFQDAAIGIAIPGISRNDVSLSIFPLPPLNEQKRIVAKINELMARCGEMERLKKEQQEKQLKTNSAALHQLMESSDSGSFSSAFTFITNNFSTLYSVKENVESLNKSILQLAMMGKLVPQDKYDQPASELLKEIKAEKEKLIAEGKIKKQKPLPEIKAEEVPYELPEGWVWTRLGELGDVQTGTTPPTKDPHNYGNFIPFIGPGDIQNYKINISNNGLSEKGLEKARFIRSNSIMMVCIGGSIGKLAINKVDITCNQQINTITPIVENYDYIFNTLSSEYFQEKVISSAGGSATPIINKNKWSAIAVPLPPLNEQKRIVAKINELMLLCENLIDKIDQSEQTQEKLLQSVLSQV